MTAEFEGIAELLLVILAITCIVQVILVGLLVLYVKRMSDSLGTARVAPPPPARGTGPVGTPVAGTTETVVPGEETHPPAVEILEGSSDIQGSIHRLCEKYHLSDFIIATLDGLVVVSLSPGSSEEAARSSDLFRRKKKPDSPGVTFLEITHQGEAMLAILRSDHPVPADQLKGIGEDARKILNWWL